MLAIINTTVVFVSFLIAVFLLFIRKCGKTLIALKVYYIVMATFEIITFYLARKQINNHYLFVYYSTISSLLYGLFFHFFFKEIHLNSYAVKRPLIFFSMAFLIIVLNNLFIQRMDISLLLMNLPVLTFCFISFYYIMEIEVEFNMYKLFIISTFLMHGVSLLIFALKDVIFTLSKEMQTNIFIVRSSVTLVAKLIILVYILSMLAKKISMSKINE